MLDWLRDQEVHAFLESMPYKIAQKYMMDSVGYVPTICWLATTAVLAIVVGGIVDASVGTSIPDVLSTLPSSLATIATIFVSTAMFARYTYSRIRANVEATSTNGLLVVCPACGTSNPGLADVACECGCIVRPFGIQ